MKRINNIISKRIILLGLFAFASVIPVFSQPPPPPPPPVSGTPIEGGLVYLLVVGIAYGLKEMKFLKKKKLA